MALDFINHFKLCAKIYQQWAESEESQLKETNEKRNTIPNPFTLFFSNLTSYNIHLPSYNIQLPSYNSHLPSYNINLSSYNTHLPSHNIHTLWQWVSYFQTWNITPVPFILLIAD